MGVAIRNAERLGFHREGTVLKLSPFETERRRRLWWHLQHLDLAVSAHSGLTALTLMGDWDTQMPLNIEDRDMDSAMEEFPKEREGLTSMSHCLWCYWVLERQRSFKRSDGSRYGLAWIGSRDLTHAAKEKLLQSIEDGLNQKFLRYCDLIKPLHVLILIISRSFICVMRRYLAFPLTHNWKVTDLSQDHRKKLFDICVQCLEYDVAARTTESIKQFYWFFRTVFQWSSRKFPADLPTYPLLLVLIPLVIYVLIEASQECNTNRAEEAWELISKVYLANPELKDLHDDRRKVYAAELMVTAWKQREAFLLDRHQQKPELYPNPSKPSFVANLESRLVESANSGEARAIANEGIGNIGEANGVQTAAGGQRPAEMTSALDHSQWSGLPASSYTDMGVMGDINLEEFDWSFWESLDAIPNEGFRLT